LAPKDEQAMALGLQIDQMEAELEAVGRTQDDLDIQMKVIY